MNDSTTQAASNAMAVPERKARGMSDHLLIGLALLRTNWNERNLSFLDNFVPFVVDCLNDPKPRRTMTLAGVQVQVRESFGIDIPQAALTTVLRRATRLKLATLNNGIYTSTAKAHAIPPLAVKRGEVERQIVSLISKFVQHLEDEHRETWTHEQAERVLRQFVEARAIPLLRQSLQGRPPGPVRADERQVDYLASSFVLMLQTSDPEGFRYLTDLVKSSMLTAGLYLDLGRIEQGFSNLTAFLDTPLVLSLLGAHGEDLRAAALEVVGMAHGFQVVVACFPDTLTEARGVLHAVATEKRMLMQGIRSERPPRAVQIDLSPVDIEELASTAEAVLATAGVVIRQKPPVTPESATDVMALERCLQECVGYSNEFARKHDAICLEAVHGVRDGQRQVQLERAKSIFITTNENVVRAAARHFGTDGDPLEVPVAMMDHEFATILWVKKPTAAPDLPWRQLIADCHAALNPDDALWARYLVAIDDLAERGEIDDDLYFITRFGNESRAAVMERTQGRPDRLDGVVTDIVEDVRAAVRASSEARADTAEFELRDIQLKAEEQRVKDEEQRVKDEENSRKAVKAATRAAAAGAASRARQETRREDALKIAEPIGARVRRGVLLIIVLLTLVLILQATSSGPWASADRSPFWTWVLIVALVVLFGAQMFGVPPIQWAHGLERLVVKRVAGKYEKRFADSSDAESPLQVSIDVTETDQIIAIPEPEEAVGTS